MINITTAILFWGLSVGYNGAPHYDMKQVDTFPTKEECYETAKAVMANHPQYVTARCYLGCKGVNRECAEKKHEHFERKHLGGGSDET